MSRPWVCTIASNNYLALASVFADSFRANHPEHEICCCVVDRPHPEVDYEALPFRVVFAEELGIPVFRNLAFRYDILELNTAVKPFLLSYLRDHFGADSALYFDPDILVCDQLAGIEQALRDHLAVLTPHITAPLDNDFNPSERKIRMVGVYNLGFLGLRLEETTRAFLDWWQQRVFLWGQNDPFNGVFVDQGWMDFAPSFLEPIAILRDPIYNIAYWNLLHRRITNHNGTWQIEGRPVGFVHFSGVDLADTTTLSRHQDRISFTERPELGPLLADYRDRILARGHQELRALPYAFDRLGAGGDKIPPIARCALHQVDPCGRRWPDPFSTTGPDSFQTWLTAPVDLPRGRLNRLLLSLWENRPHLVREFRQVCTADLDDYVRWLIVEGGAAQEKIPPSYLEGVGAGTTPGRSGQNQPERTPAEAGGWDRAARVLASTDLSNPGPMAAWLNEPVPGATSARPLITHLAMLVYETRADIQREYPDPLGRDQKSFADWFCRCGSVELELAPELVRPVLSSLPLAKRLRLRLQGVGSRTKEARSSGAPPPSSTAAQTRSQAPSETTTLEQAPLCTGHGAPGVNVASFSDATLLPEVLAESVDMVLEGSGHPRVVARLHGDVWGKISGGRIVQPTGLPYPFTVLCCHASDTMTALSRLPASVTVGGTVIAYWLWDLSCQPIELGRQFGGVNEVWVPTRFCREALSPLADVAVRCVPPFVVDLPGEAFDRAELGLDPDSVCLQAVCNLADGVGMTNPDGALEVLRLLHHEAPGRFEMVLLVEQSGADIRVAAELRERARGLPVVVIDEPITDAHRRRLLATCDVVLSLHRAGAFNPRIVEAMFMKKPIVATGYGGITDLLDETTGYPVPWHKTRLQRAEGPYPAGAIWSEPDLGAAAALVLSIAESPEDARTCAAEARRHALARHGLDPVRKQLEAELERLS